MNARTLFCLLLLAAVYSLNEPQTDNIAVEPLSPACKQRQTNTAAGKTCYDWEGKVSAGPSPYPCPCLDDDVNGGCYPGTGKVEAPNNFADGFSDYTIGQNPPAGFTSLTGMAFTDNTREIYVVAKAGFLFRVDIPSETITQVYDFSSQVHDNGDYGSLSIETHTDFAKNPYVYVSYVNGSMIGDGTEFNTISFVRVMRITVSAGQMTDMKYIIGVDHLDSNVLCSSSHAGGALAMGHDGSLFITLGEGALFDTDVMDFGQTQARYPFSGYCGVFFPGQAMGSIRAQSKDTLGGKLIRVDPATGDGICSGGNTAFSVYNPYCVAGQSLRAPRSRIYAMGFRNPFSMNVRPQKDGETGPGVPYVGDVGLGSFEEVNAVTRPGLNFGWPCWEGPLPMGGQRESPMQNLNYPDPTITRPVNDAGQNFSCNYVYASVETTHPTYYWSRYTHQMGGLYGEQYVLGAGFTGNCVSGVGFYTGSNYPASFKNQVFFSDYGTQWIKSFTTNGDSFVQQFDFEPMNVPIIDLETNPDNGDLCYLELLAGVIHCIAYQSGPQAPVVEASANATAGVLPLTVAFNADGSYDLADGTITWVAWDFGDGSSPSVGPNPVHTYTTAGTYTATMYIRDGNFTESSSVVIKAGASQPVATITQPGAGNTSSFSFYTYNSTANPSITFSGCAAGGAAPYTYFWDIYMVHTNHYHPESFTSRQQSFTTTLTAMGASSHIGERINFLATLTVTDSNGVSAKTYIRMSDVGGYNSVPVPLFTFQNPSPLTTGQFVRFDASKTYDVDLDTVTCLWDFGDGNTVGFNPQQNNKYISHSYQQPGTYVVTMTAKDNYGAENKTVSSVTVAAGYVQTPPAVVLPSTPTVTSGATPSNSTTSSGASGSTTGASTGSSTGSGNTTSARTTGVSKPTQSDATALTGCVALLLLALVF